MTRDNATFRAREIAGYLVAVSTSTETSPAADKEPSGAAKMFGDFAPALVSFTDDTLFGQLWTRPELSPRDRSLVTVTALATAGNTEQLTYHLDLARQNGVTETELIEAITHLAFYAGWPRAMSAMTVAKQVLGGNQKAAATAAGTH
jgi:4-carboxymuconolactone decarboxylase